MLPTIAWQEDAVVMVDQRKLPTQEVYLRCRTAAEVARAIRTMVIRGAPAIGVAAAMGLALGAKHSKAKGPRQFAVEFQKTCDLLAATRPTAVNLFWAIERMKRLVNAHSEGSIEALKTRLKEEAINMGEEDIAINRKMGEMGRDLIRDGDTVLTHCNAGALATAGYGTALGVIRAAHEQERGLSVQNGDGAD